MQDYIGKFISLSCKDPLGFFQGQIVHVDGIAQKLTLEKAFQNGYPYYSRQVTISADDIKYMEMIDGHSEPAPSTPASVIKRPIPKKLIPVIGIVERPILGKDSSFREPSKKPSDDFHKPSCSNEAMKALNQLKRDKQKQKWLLKNEEAFGAPASQHMTPDFDFEKNLALFNKKAFYEELAAGKSDAVRHPDRRGAKTRTDEIPSTSRASGRHIFISRPPAVEYVTDSGVVVPSVTPEVREKISTVAEKFGFSFERQCEIIGRACTEMAITLLGGAKRINIQNLHQMPTVAILCGSHRCGVQGVNTARQLATQGVQTIVFVEDPVNLTTEMTHELGLYRMTGNRVTTKLHDLNIQRIDLIILALLEYRSPDVGIITPTAKWANESRAQILSLDPPQQGTPGITSKYSLVPSLPLAYHMCNGKIYLCNVNIPVHVFKDVGVIDYVAPFGPKFYMAIHPNDPRTR